MQSWHINVNIAHYGTTRKWWKSFTRLTFRTSSLLTVQKYLKFRQHTECIAAYIPDEIVQYHNFTILLAVIKRRCYYWDNTQRQQAIWPYNSCPSLLSTQHNNWHLLNISYLTNNTKAEMNLMITWSVNSNLTDRTTCFIRNHISFRTL